MYYLPAAKKTTLITAVNVCATDPDPILLPSGFFIGIVAVPSIGWNDKHRSTTQGHTFFRSHVKPPAPLCDVNQLIVIHNPAFTDIEKIVFGMAHQRGITVVVCRNKAFTDIVDRYSPEAIVISADQIGKTLPQHKTIISILYTKNFRVIMNTLLMKKLTKTYDLQKAHRNTREAKQGRQKSHKPLVELTFIRNFHRANNTSTS